jgi:hypothetical protein
LGHAYVAGSTSSTDFPTMNALQPIYGGAYDAFVTKLNPAGSALVYSTYLGGSGYDIGTSIAVDGSGNAYVAGFTSSTDFPTKNPLQPAFGGEYDAFVAKIFEPKGELVSGYELFKGYNCHIGGEPAICGASFSGWTGESSQGGWLRFPGTKQGAWVIVIDYTGTPEFGGSVLLVGGNWFFIYSHSGKVVDGTVTNGKVTWPPTENSSLGCGDGVATVFATLSESGGGIANLTGCLHDLPAGTIIPPRAWGSFAF